MADGPSVYGLGGEAKGGHIGNVVRVNSVAVGITVNGVSPKGTRVMGATREKILSLISTGIFSSHDFPRFA